MITAVIFDMDGVIADSEYFNIKAKHMILQKAAGMRCIGYAPEDAVKQDIHLADVIVHEFSSEMLKYFE